MVGRKEGERAGGRGRGVRGRKGGREVSVKGVRRQEEG